MNGAFPFRRKGLYVGFLHFLRNFTVHRTMLKPTKKGCTMWFPPDETGNDTGMRRCLVLPIGVNPAGYTDPV